jgi:hypothetical protein
VLAADLFLAFSDDDDVHRQLLPHREMGFERFDVQKKLPLIVDRATSEDLSIPYRRLERGRSPQLERLGRLHVVVTVDDYRRRARRIFPFTDDYWMSGGWMNRCRDADPVERGLEPFGRALRVIVVLGFRAHARNPQELEQLHANARVVVGEEFFEIGRDRRSSHRV